MSFSSDAWARNAALYEKTRTMPFNRAGQRPARRARVPPLHDPGRPLPVAFGRALAVAAAKADNADGVVQFADAAKNAVVVERSLHDGFMKQFGISADTFNATRSRPPATTTPATSSPPPERALPVALAALLPCFWIYAEIGRDIHARAVQPNPYSAWIDTYAGEEFHTLVREVIASVDRAAELASAVTVKAMHEAYTRRAAGMDVLGFRVSARHMGGLAQSRRHARHGKGALP